MKKLTLILALILFSSIGFTEENTGPHGGTVVENATHKFEVKIDSDANHIEVYSLNGNKKPAPKKMAITLFRDSGTGQTVQLKAVNLKDPLPKYQGELSASAGSYVGAELRFEVSLKSFEVLKFVPYIPNRGGRF